MLSLLRRECNIVLKKRLAVFIVLLGAASAYSLLIGNLYSGHVVTHVPIVICDLENSAASREFIRAIDTVDTYEVMATGQQAESEALVAKGKAAAAVVIPPDFSTRLAQGNALPVAVISDGTNTIQQNYMLTNIQEVIGTFNAAYGMQYYAALGVTNIPAVPVQVSVRVSDNPTNSYALFYLYGVMLTAAQLGVMLAVAMSIHQDKGTVYDTILAIAAKEVFYGVLAVAAAGLGLFLLVSIWHMPFKGSLLPLFGLYVCFVAVIMNMAVLIARYFNTTIAMIQCLVFYALPAFLLAGYIWPAQVMLPMWRGIASLIPLHYIMSDFRSIALTGTAPQAATDMMVMASCAVGLGIVNSFLLLRKKHRAAIKLS